MRACLYLRYSSRAQNEQTIDTQERICRDYCGRKGYEITARYSDPARSAYHNAEKRPGLQLMMREARLGRFDLVIVYKIDRFFRNWMLAGKYEYDLQQCGVRIESATEDFLNDPKDGVQIHCLYLGMAQSYSATLSQRVSDGMHQTAMSHKANGGKVPYGYSVDAEGHYVINEAEAAIIRRYLQEYGSGMSQKDIIDRLNNEGLRTREGKRFTKTSFYYTPFSEKYKGVFVFGKSFRDEGGMPRIVDDETWERANRRAKGARRMRQGKTGDYALSGRLFCGKCGCRMTGCYGEGNGGRYYYYQCPEKDCKPVPRDIIEKSVLRAVKNLMTDEWIGRLSELAEEESRKQAGNMGLDLKEAELKENDRRTNNLTLSLEAIGFDERITSRLKELKADRRRIEGQIDDIRREMMITSKESVSAFLRSFRDGDVNDPIYGKGLLTALVLRVVYFGDSCDVYINAEDPQQKEPLPKGSGSDEFIMVHRAMLHSNRPWYFRMTFAVIYPLPDNGERRRSSRNAFSLIP